jgi:hypothetical protein
MMRVWWAVLVLLATAGASPTSPQPALPLPPIPPDHPPTDQSAPVPDRDVLRPSDPADDSPRVAVRDFRVRRFYQGYGYAPGSQFETSEEKRPIQTPGLTVQVPLQ